jgi:hypothetical protein
MRQTLQCISKIAAVCLTMPTFTSTYASQKVRIVVRVPADAPVTGCRLASQRRRLEGGGVKLARQADSTYAGNIDLEAGQTLNFKITRGTWQMVEKNADGSEHPNRIVVVDAVTK